MAKSIEDIPKKRGRKKTTGRGTGVLVRLHEPTLAALDEWRAGDEQKLSRPEAIRRLVEGGIGNAERAPARSSQHGAFADVQALVFDVFGTVVDWRSGVAREAAPFLARYAPAADPFAFADAWRSRYNPAMEEVRSGRRPFARLDVLHRESLQAVLLEFKIDPASVPSPKLDALNLAWHRLDPWHDAVPGLLRLKRRFIIAPLSNGNIRLMLDMAKRAELPWDAILGAEIAQAYKPSREAYLRSVDALMLKPEQVCLVAAHSSDLAAARGCGLRTAFVRRPMESGPNRSADIDADKDWEVTARDFEDLAGQLGL
jgi:2-haloacid dehalogenase